MTLPVKRNIEETLASSRSFACKTCDKRFPTFQALGGHRASHKRPRLEDDRSPSSPPKQKSHTCPLCRLEFPMGQALGGHMRRHRAELEARSGKSVKVSSESLVGVSWDSATNSGTRGSSGLDAEVVKRPTCRIFGVDFMSLVNPEEDGLMMTPNLKLGIGLTAN